MRRRYGYAVSVSVLALLVASGAQGAQADSNGAAPAQLAAAAGASGGAVTDSDVIVTGTREAGRRAQDSPTPVQVINNDALVATGQTNALEALKVVLPSLNTLAVGGDLGNLIKSFALRGLAPDHTLVLVNGKRRHQSAYLNTGGGVFQGSNPVDLQLIPLSAIDHIEVLTDGAAAQYGTDAIAGVVNIILKNSDHGATVTGTGGLTSGGDGATGQIGADAGAKLGDDGFIHLSFDYDHQDHTNRSAYGPATPNATAVAHGVTKYSVLQEITGDPAYDTEALGFNLDKPVNNDISVYGFGTFAHRYAESIQNYRYPYQLNTAVNTVYPTGFFPVEAIDEYDYAVTAGVKGKSLLGWEWDLSTTYGEDIDNISTIKSINANLAKTGIYQTNFNDGQFTSGQLTTNLDIHRPVYTGLWGAPLNVAIGLEHRYETFHVGAGEFNSWDVGGAAAFPGFQNPTTSSRNVEAAYLDLSTHFTPKWQVDLSGRVENYDDVGSGVTGKAATRYDFAPWLGVRASFGNGYHAPTLAQDNFQTLNVSPTTATAQLPVTSAAARSLGASPLKPETSENISFGLVSEPIPRLHASLDAYQITIDNRIVDTGVLTGNAAANALQLFGVNTANLGAVTSGVQFYTNGVNTRTQGVDLNADYSSDFGEHGTVKWFLNANYNNTTITHIATAPAAFGGASLLSLSGISALTTATPRDKVTIGGTWYFDKWEVTLRETRFEKTKNYTTPNNVNYYIQTVNAAFITYLNLRYNISEKWSVDVGANNLFAVEPNKTSLVSRGSTGAGQYASFSPYGIDGGYYFARITAKF